MMKTHLVTLAPLKNYATRRLPERSFLRSLISNMPSEIDGREFVGQVIVLLKLLDDDIARGKLETLEHVKIQSRGGETAESRGPEMGPRIRKSGGARIAQSSREAVSSVRE
jgi:hypothetical protein